MTTQRRQAVTALVAGGILFASLAATDFSRAAAPTPAGTPAKKPPASSAARVKSVTLGIRHRVFQNFSEVQTVALQKEFPVGDTEYSARIVRYVPDFAMDLKTKKIVSRSNEPKNPAFEIVIREKKVAQDTVWAFLNMPPHFARKSLLAFKIARIDFVGRASVVPDTTRAAAAPGSPHPGTKP
ncbi:MAG TPA: hypothetical protein VFT32_11655 [Candidatus Eisenbacteria bacterium]|nr:hypothetical protein [Candidatus Eisenbacteria bacterium]